MATSIASMTDSMASMVDSKRTIQEPQASAPLFPELAEKTGAFPRSPLDAGRILFATLPTRRLRLSQPLEAILEKHEDSVIARLDEIEEFGIGENVTAAIEDLGRTVVELYLTLQAIRDEELSSDLVRVKENLAARLILQSW